MSDGFEWLGDVDDHETEAEKEEIAKELMGDRYSNSYQEPDRNFDTELNASEKYIESLPDLQNGPSSLIQGAPVEIQQVGIHNFKVPISYKQRDRAESIKLETSVTGTVSLEAEKKGINMSRIIRTFYEHKDKDFSLDLLKHVLEDYKKRLGTFDAHLVATFSYPIMQPSLRSGLEGYQYYDVSLEATLNKKGVLNKYMHMDFVYSSACPCSYELAEHARKYRNKAVVPHSQRSVARITVKLTPGKFLWIEELKELAAAALKTETQVMVKREDEQAFAELNGSYTKFVEDAARLMYEALDNDDRIEDFRVVHTHLESLHSHDAVSVIVKGVEGGFKAEVDPHVFKSMVR